MHDTASPSAASSLPTPSDSSSDFASPASSDSCVASARDRDQKPLLQPSAAPPKIAIATSITASPQSLFNGPATPSSGPMNGSYAIPPRPKPGRKPATDEPQTKRKAQNREAQRNFRQRKAQKLNDLELEVSRKERLFHEEKAALHAKIESLEGQNQYQQQQINRLLADSRDLQSKLKESIEQSQRFQSERDYWKSKYESARDTRSPSIGESHVLDAGIPKGAPLSPPVLTIHTLGSGIVANRKPRQPAPDGCGNCEINGECACVESLINAPALKHSSTPPHSHGQEPVSPISDVRMSDAPANDTPEPMSSYEDREIDFTTHRPVVEKPAQDKRTSVAFMIEDKCGFCTDSTNCICAAEAARAVQETILSEKDLVSLTPMPAVPLNRRPNPSKSKPVLSGPGSCDQCRANPLQAEWCRAVARGKLNDTGRTTRSSSNAAPLPSAEGPSSLNGSRRLPSLGPAPRYTVGCSDAFRLFDGRIPMDRDKMDWTRELVPVPRGSSQSVELPSIREAAPEPERGWSAYEIDSASILGALQHHDRRHSTVKRSDSTLLEAKKILRSPQRYGRESSAGRGNEPSGSLGKILN